MNRLPPLNSASSFGSDPSNYSYKEKTTAHHGTDIVHLNAGGRRFTTLLDTLVQGKSTFFLNFVRVDQVSGKVIMNHQRVSKDESGAIFINRDGKLFSYVLQYMRDGRNTVLPDDQNLLKRLRREAEFFGIEGLKQAINSALIQRRTSAEDEDQSDIAQIRNSVSQIANNLYYNGFKR
ncbi:unnamed protein product [Caenorhabditis auriculariae]|uniref:BTB domain-containing protein n=1 Tax=Caenorhabditis auriculariae TaxID=2777116 RepID=A0A8S1GV38_9PELO|nr:unnamed protein product [Caenorhabditis auriculariae]